MSSVRYILRGTRAESHAQVGGICLEAFLEVDGVEERDDEVGGFRQAQYSSEDGRTALLHVEDHLANCDYVDLYGDDIHDLVELVERRLNYWSSEDLRAACSVAASAHDLRRAVLRLGPALSLAPYSKDDFEFLSSTTFHGVAEVRLAALRAIAYCPWPELNAVLEAAIRDDPDEACRARASHTLQAKETERRRAAEQGPDEM